MANTNKPMGLSPVQYLNGSPWNGQARQYYIPSANTSAFAIGDPVASSASADANGVPAFQLRPEIVLDVPVTSPWRLGVGTPRVFMFTPPSNGYNYVAQCSARGECLEETGLCYCYQGFDLADCSRMTAPAG